jgi:AraC-like DNA-binding protein
MAYRELLQRDEHVACLWARDPAPYERRQRVLPDACVDLVVVGDRLLVAGPQTTARVVTVPAGAASVGVRFRVGAAGAALGVPAAELLDVTVDLDELWDRATVERVLGSPAPLRELAAAVREGLVRPPDDLVRAAVTGAGRDELGIGDRQLRRRFADAVGYGPKTLERILRFQRFLRLATDGHGDLARLALEAGYADQAHLTRECSRLAGLPPAALLASGAGPAGERSVSFKTGAGTAATMAA